MKVQLNPLLYFQFLLPWRFTKIASIPLIIHMHIVVYICIIHKKIEVIPINISGIKNYPNMPQCDVSTKQSELEMSQFLRASFSNQL